MKFTIKRREWLRGRGPVESYLLREDGLKCCVGFFCLANGVKPEDIQLHKEIVKTTPIDPLLRVDFLESHGRTSWAELLYVTNDNPSISDADRETSLIEQFAQKGHIVEFVD